MSGKSDKDNDWQTVMLPCGEPFGVRLTFKKQDCKDEKK
jgi:hypothetical protein